MKLADLLNRRQYSLRWFKKQNEIVKYKPEGYNERGVYTLDELFLCWPLLLQKKIKNGRV